MAIPLHVGTYASCVLDPITNAKSGATQIGTLSDVYKDDTYSTEWFTGIALTETVYGSLDFPYLLQTPPYDNALD